MAAEDRNSSRGNSRGGSFGGGGGGRRGASSSGRSNPRFKGARDGEARPVDGESEFGRDADDAPQRPRRPYVPGAGRDIKRDRTGGRGGFDRDRPRGEFGGERRERRDFGPQRDGGDRPRRFEERDDRGGYRGDSQRNQSGAARGPRGLSSPRNPREVSSSSGREKGGQYGALARKGARIVSPRSDGQSYSPSDNSAKKYSTPQPLDQWVDKGKGKSKAPQRSETGGGVVGYNVEEIIARETPKGLSKFRVARIKREFSEGVRAYQADRYRDAQKLLVGLLELMPQSQSLLEIIGLNFYRLSRWKLALEYLEASKAITKSVDQNPVIADCYRALGRHNKVKEIYDEVGEVSPSAEVMAEARIVLAGSLADQKKFTEAIALLARFEDTERRKPRLIEIRQWYVLADLYEKVGDIVHARKLFQKIAMSEPGIYDVAERLADLR